MDIKSLTSILPSNWIKISKSVPRIWEYANFPGGTETESSECCTFAPCSCLFLTFSLYFFIFMNIVNEDIPGCETVVVTRQAKLLWFTDFCALTVVFHASWAVRLLIIKSANDDNDDDDDNDSIRCQQLRRATDLQPRAGEVLGWSHVAVLWR